MKAEAVKKIREAMIPRVIFESAYDVPDGIDFVMRMEYGSGNTPPDWPRRVVKTVSGKADKDGNILSCKGLF